jgi:hypothetical protein
MSMYRNEEVGTMTHRYCADCGGERPFEQFHTEECPDVPGDCPEWGCTACGAALIIGLLVPGYITGDGVFQAA